MVYNNFLTTNELQQIFTLSPKWTKGTTIKKQSTRIVDTYNITGKFEWLDQKVAQVVKERNKSFNFKLKRINETKLLRYKPGGKYDWHQDVIYTDSEQRKFTYIIQLSNSNEYAGGDFQFRDADNIDLSRFREQGSLIIFPSLMYHRITPLTQGTRYSIVGWVVGPPWT